MIDKDWGPWVTHVPGLLKHRLKINRYSTNIDYCEIQVEKVFRLTMHFKLATADGVRNYRTLCDKLIATDGKDTATVFRSLSFTEAEHLFLTTGTFVTETI